MNLDDFLLERVSKGLVATSEQLISDCNEVFDNPRLWGHGFGVTHRRNGEVVVGRFRNIVDTGELRNSSEVRDRSQTSKQVAWTAEHAEEVYFGEGRKPGRKWVDYGIDEQNLKAAFVRGFQS